MRNLRHHVIVVLVLLGGACANSVTGGEYVANVHADGNVQFDVNSYSSTDGSINSDTDFGVKQIIPHPDLGLQVEEHIRNTITYMRDDVMIKDLYASTRHICRNKHESCSYWASIGECQKNPSYMTVNCAPACQQCELLDLSIRCPLDPNATDAFKPGDLNKMFERISTSEEFAKYSPTVLSRPYHVDNDVGGSKESGTSNSNSSYQVGPWVMIFDNFLTGEECDRLVALGHQQVYKRSTGTARKPNDDGTYGGDVSDSRTSENTWCLGSCYTDPVARDVMARIEYVTGVPERNSEYLQLLKYEEGQYYRDHHDYIDFHKDRPCGVRMLTFFLYLNDVEKGGATRFTNLDLIVQPRKGRALVWPSVLDSDPHAEDRRTHHEAMPVLRGIKYGANAWVHIHDFKGPYMRACTN